jgi:hypothetical protein
MDIISPIVALFLLIAFVITAFNVESILRTLKRIERNSISTMLTLDRIANKLAPHEEPQKSPDQMTVEEKARAYDRGKSK